MTNEELDRLEKLASKATPGPWEWAEDRFNWKYRRRKKDGTFAAKAGKRLTDSWVFCLVGPHSWCPPGRPVDPETGIPRGLDEHDYHHVMGLRWFHVKVKTLFNVSPSPADEAFIAASRSAVPELIAEVRRLRAELEKVKP